MPWAMTLTDFYNRIGTVPQIIIGISIMMMCGFLMTRITKRLKLPNVTAYIIAGIIIGPFCFNLVPHPVIEGMDFISDIALAFIAFSTGEFFKVSVIKKNGPRVIIITLFEALLASLLVFILTFFILKLSLEFSIVLAALASATAPASTMMTIRQTGAHGNFVDTLLQVVALDDIVALLAYSIAIAIAKSGTDGSFGILEVLSTIGINILVLIIGGVFGLIMKLMMPKSRSTDNRLIISISILFIFCGICALLDISPLLGCMSMGMVYINITNDERLFRQLGYFSPPILLLFFVRSGANFNLEALVSKSSLGAIPLIVIGVLYFIIRIVGKYGGAYLGGLVTKSEKRVRNYLGLALIPQAGVAIGLAALGARILGGETGVALNTIILASSVLYELIGPASAKLSLFLSRSYGNELEEIKVENEEKKSEVEILIDKINKIKAQIPEHTTEELNEAAFDEAAYEQYEGSIVNPRIKYRNRRGR